jgi:transposase-like protein
MLDSLTIRKSARRCNISVKTAFKWRHQFLALPNLAKSDNLSGIIEIDETLFRYSEKGSRQLTRKPHKRSGDKAGRGRAKGDWVPVLVAIDRNKQVFDECLEQADTDTLLDLLKDKIEDDSVVCSDGFLSYRKMTKNMNVEHKVLNATNGERVKEGVFHIQNVNAYHSRLHQWMGMFRGVATKYLPNYLGGFKVFETYDKPNENSILAMQTQLT